MPLRLLLVMLMLGATSRLALAADIVYDFSDPADAWEFHNEPDDIVQIIPITWNVSNERFGFTTPPPEPNKYIDTWAIGPPFKIPLPRSGFWFQMDFDYLTNSEKNSSWDNIHVAIYKGEVSRWDKVIYEPDADSGDPIQPEPGTTHTFCDDGSCAPIFDDDEPDSVYQLWLTAEDYDPDQDSLGWVRFDNFILHNAEPVQTPLAGDYNGDGGVDAADYVVWRNGLDSTYAAADYEVWKAHFGESLAAAAPSNPLAVPEASALLLLAGTGVVWSLTGSRLRLSTASRR